MSRITIDITEKKYSICPTAKKRRTISSAVYDKEHWFPKTTTNTIPPQMKNKPMKSTLPIFSFSSNGAQTALPTKLTDASAERTDCGAYGEATKKIAVPKMYIIKPVITLQFPRSSFGISSCLVCILLNTKPKLLTSPL